MSFPPTIPADQERARVLAEWLLDLGLPYCMEATVEEHLAEHLAAHRVRHAQGAANAVIKDWEQDVRDRAQRI